MQRAVCGRRGFTGRVVAAAATVGARVDLRLSIAMSVALALHHVRAGAKPRPPDPNQRTTLGAASTATRRQDGGDNTDVADRTSQTLDDGRLLGVLRGVPAPRRPPPEAGADPLPAPAPAGRSQAPRGRGLRRVARSGHPRQRRTKPLLRVRACAPAPCELLMAGEVPSYRLRRSASVPAGLPARPREARLPQDPPLRPRGPTKSEFT